MNFTVLSPEQQRAAQDAERIKRQKETEGMRGGGGEGGWRARRGGSGAWDGAAASHDQGRAAVRELARRGVLEREEVKAMLRPGPLQDFRGCVLQVTSPGSFVGSERRWCLPLNLSSLCAVWILRVNFARTLRVHAWMPFLLAV